MTAHEQNLIAAHQPRLASMTDAERDEYLADASKPIASRRVGARLGSISLPRLAARPRRRSRCPSRAGCCSPRRTASAQCRPAGSSPKTLGDGVVERPLVGSCWVPYRGRGVRRTRYPLEDDRCECGDACPGDGGMPDGANSDCLSRGMAHARTVTATRRSVLSLKRRGRVCPRPKRPRPHRQLRGPRPPELADERERYDDPTRYYERPAADPDRVVGGRRPACRPVGCLGGERRG